MMFRSLNRKPLTIDSHENSLQNPCSTGIQASGAAAISTPKRRDLSANSGQKEMMATHE